MNDQSLQAPEDTKASEVLPHLKVETQDMDVTTSVLDRFKENAPWVDSAAITSALTHALMGTFTIILKINPSIADAEKGVEPKVYRDTVQESHVKALPIRKVDRTRSIICKQLRHKTQPLSKAVIRNRDIPMDLIDWRVLESLVQVYLQGRPSGNAVYDTALKTIFKLIRFKNHKENINVITIEYTDRKGMETICGFNILD